MGSGRHLSAFAGLLSLRGVESPAVVTRTDALVIADWYREQGEEGPFATLIRLANDLE